MIFLLLILLVLLPPLPLFPASLEESNIQEILQILQHQGAKKLPNPKPTLTEALAALGPGSLIMSELPPPSTNPQPIRSELLPGKIAYWRMPSFKPEKDWVAMENQLRDWAKSGLTGILLDVRNFQASTDFTGAAHAASLFSPPLVTLFSLQGLQIPQQLYASTRSQNPIQAPLVLLINRQTVGASEVFASTLRETAKAILIGRSTAGQGGLYTDFRLKSGQYLRMPSASALLPDGTRILGKPIQPDLDVFADDLRERQAIIEGQMKGTSKVIGEIPKRMKMSESSLVRQENPEIDEVMSNPGKNPPQIQDIALIRGMDVLRGISLICPKASGKGFP